MLGIPVQSFLVQPGRPIAYDVEHGCIVTKVLIDGRKIYSRNPKNTSDLLKFKVG
jgi:hypothetical protein